MDCVGFEAHGHGKDASVERPATVLNSIHGSHAAPAAPSASPACTSPAIPAASTQTPRSARSASASAWAGRSRMLFHTGQCPVMRYNRQLMHGDPARQDPDRQGRQRHDDYAGRGAARATRTSTKARPRSSSSIRTDCAESRGLVGIANARLNRAATGEAELWWQANARLHQSRS